MSTALILLTASAFVGLAIGLKYRIVVIALAGPALALVAAIGLRDFGFVAAAAITFVCITLSQVAYVAGAWLRTLDSIILAVVAFSATMSVRLGR